jgi:predicted SprT family Zn-dependent metalloprotease
LRELLRQWATRWRVPDLLDGVTFRQNARLRTTIARWVIKSNTLEVGERFFDLRFDHREILCHELAHAAAVIMHGRAVRPHGPGWRELVRSAGYEPKTYYIIDRTTHNCREEVRTPLIYEHRCPVCHAVRFGRKAVTNWRCIECIGAGLPGYLTVTVRPHKPGVQ